MKTVIIAGGSGTIGSRLVKVLTSQGYKTLILTRNQAKIKNGENYIYWNVEKGEVDRQISQADYIINLAGAGIAEGKWTKKRKELITSSRIKSTKLLISEMRKHSMKIESFISASAIGYYGDGGDQVLTEESNVITKEFLSDVCVQWEKEALEAKPYCEKLVIVRIGTVLSREGGALEKMDKSIPLGIASYLGKGNQLMSWIHITDLCDMILHTITRELEGVYNGVAPEVVTNKNFTKKLRDAINPRAFLVGVPSIALRLTLGEMSSVVLNNSNVSPNKILNSGFRFSFPSLTKALEDLYNNA